MADLTHSYSWSYSFRRHRLLLISVFHILMGFTGASIKAGEHYYWSAGAAKGRAYTAPMPADLPQGGLCACGRGVG